MESPKNEKHDQKLIVAALAQARQCDLQSSELQKTIELRAQQQRRATLMQPPQYDLQAASYKRP